MATKVSPHHNQQDFTKDEAQMILALLDLAAKAGGLGGENFEQAQQTFLIMSSVKQKAVSIIDGLPDDGTKDSAPPAVKSRRNP